MAEARTQAAEELARRWATDPRWRGVERTYGADDVVRLSGSVREEHTLARRGAGRPRPPRRVAGSRRLAPPG
ncbi:hypothetical protein GCM10010341_66670 [Streptomyces noursei]|nr:hypothetical protein GCM10010341_66670 [Streptomyces noursei]